MFESTMVPASLTSVKRLIADLRTFFCCSIFLGCPSGLPKGNREYKERGGFTNSAISFAIVNVTVGISYSSIVLATRPAVC
ncbi:hypothetical protein [Pseudalkalibacillus berkeleyi]|uniref:Uncharacterized protein n=1 Tax=Pseudalkalibacillus berkeleyi TaxID=1069813 RepID=A0ABS9H090_9BACL|nr:hypothetical protein [Pseudalkalibacillus berkeleyi]MCF6137355.1 hypothetical protein [Pseudalkalibacillus berkeleyi]